MANGERRLTVIPASPSVAPGLTGGPGVAPDSAAPERRMAWIPAFRCASTGMTAEA
jgi:hypothetical protein